MDLKAMLARIDAGITELNRRAATGEDVGTELAQLNAARTLGSADPDSLRHVLGVSHGASRFATEAASREGLAQLAAGGEGGDVSLAAGGGEYHGGVFVPNRDALAVGRALGKAMAEGTSTAGGLLVPVQLSPELVTLLRSKAVLLRAGARVVPGVEKELDLPGVSTGTTAAWVAENGVIPYSEMTLAAGPKLVPRDLASLTALSRRVVRDAASNPSIAQAVVSDLLENMGLKFDLSALQGTGTGGEPLGIRGTSGLTVGPSLGANGGIPDLDFFKKGVAALRGANAVWDGSAAWIFNSRTLDGISRLKDADGHYLAEGDNLLSFDAQDATSGTFLGIKFYVSNQVPSAITKGTSNDTTYAVLGSAMSELWVGLNDELRVERSTEASYTPDGGTTWISAFQSGQVLMKATQCIDVVARRPACFCVLDGIRPVA